MPAGEETRALEAELAPEAVATTRQAARSTDKVLILASSVSGGMNSREALAVRSFSPSTLIHAKTPDQWRAMTAEQFMEYRALIIGDAACESGTAAFDAAVEQAAPHLGRHRRQQRGAHQLGIRPRTTPTSVENAINMVVVDSIQYRTGMYISLGCASRARRPTRW